MLGRSSPKQPTGMGPSFPCSTATPLRSTGARSERNDTLGPNWRPERNLRLMANDVHALASPSAAFVTERAVRDDSFVGRLQLYR